MSVGKQSSSDIGFCQLINGQDLARARRNGCLSAFCRFIGQARVA
jgi:hypothetical protein